MQTKYVTEHKIQNRVTKKALKTSVEYIDYMLTPALISVIKRTYKSIKSWINIFMVKLFTKANDCKYIYQ